MPDGADTTRDAVAAAFKEVTAREPTPAPEPAAEPAPEPSSAAPAPEAEAAEPSKAEPKRDGKGRFIVPPKQKPAASEAPATSAPAGQGGAVSVPAPVQGAAPPAVQKALEALKPPQDWRLNAREKWAGLPREVQEEALRLHVETKKTLSEMAEVRKGYQSYQQATAPFEAMIRAEGLEPHAAVGILLQREAALRTAPMQTRAQIIAHGIRTFLGTDEAAMDMLAKAIDGQPQQNGTQQHGPIDPRQLIAQAKQEFAREFETRHNESVGRAAQGEIEAFSAAHEFMDDVDPETGLSVAEEMASLMEAAAAKNKMLSPDDAWKLATRRHSEVSKVISQREAAKAATAKAATTQAARAASSSIRSEPAGPANGRASKEVRDVVSDAYYAQKNAR